jgi:hypothetical protein
MTSPADEVTFIPAPILVVRRSADGSEMARLPTTSYLLAKKIARRWHGTVEVVVSEPRILLGGTHGQGGRPWAS